MINKIYKTIHNKFSKFFKFIFFIRYLFIIFFVAIALFLSIPIYFDYSKREEIIKFYLQENYNLRIKNIEQIVFKSLPVPHLSIKNSYINFYTEKINFKTQNLIIYPELFSIYNYKNFHVKKIKLQNINTEVDYENFNIIIDKILNSKKKINLTGLNIILKNLNEKIIEIKRINFSNYGYKKNIIIGEIFQKKFKLKLNDNLSNINFKILETGITSIININKEGTSYIGDMKGKVLNSNYKFNFKYYPGVFKIENFLFRNKNLSLDNNGIIEFNPYFKIDLNSKIKNINEDIFRFFNLKDLLGFRNLIKRLNSSNTISFKSSKFGRKLISDFVMETKLAYGTFIFEKNLLISGSRLSCKGKVNLLEEYPVLFFDCKLNSSDKKKLLKKFDINFKKRNEPLLLNLKGNMNLLNNKINFDFIEIDNDLVSKEDLKYYKTNFEEIIFDENFLDIFDLLKIRKFLTEIL